MTSVSTVAHLTDSASGPSGCPRYREIPDSEVQSRQYLGGGLAGLRVEGHRYRATAWPIIIFPASDCSFRKPLEALSRNIATQPTTFPHAMRVMSYTPIALPAHLYTWPRKGTEDYNSIIMTTTSLSLSFPLPPWTPHVDPSPRKRTALESTVCRKHVASHGISTAEPVDERQVIGRFALQRHRCRAPRGGGGR
jgi:hypothetical protein